MLAASRLPTLLCCLALLMVATTWPSPGVPAAAAATDAPNLTGTPIRSVFFRPPANASTDKPLQVLMALHGMGGDGEAFSRDLIEQADTYGWAIIAPTIAYGDWTDPAQVAREDPILIRALLDYLDTIPERTGWQVRPEVLLLGHSRGAQLAHRFAEFRPDRVLGVAALSAGTYTLPANGMGFPYGLKDLATYNAGRGFDASRFDDVPFWVGVGADDTNAADVPRQWDGLEGSTRLQRAQTFQAALHALNVHAQLRVFKGTQHDLTMDMRVSACSFLGRIAAAPRSAALGRLAAMPSAY
jgi:pimeloyl-ACP methyl ester carboxylesterase